MDFALTQVPPIPGLQMDQAMFGEIGSFYSQDYDEDLNGEYRAVVTMPLDQPQGPVTLQYHWNGWYSCADMIVTPPPPGTIFPSTRPCDNCTDHGDCEQFETGPACVCDDGWGGDSGHCDEEVLTRAQRLLLALGAVATVAGGAAFYNQREAARRTSQWNQYGSYDGGSSYGGSKVGGGAQYGGASSSRDGRSHGSRGSKRSKNGGRRTSYGSSKMSQASEATKGAFGAPVDEDGLGLASMYSSSKSSNSRRSKGSKSSRSSRRSKSGRRSTGSRRSKGSRGKSAAKLKSGGGRM